MKGKNVIWVGVVVVILITVIFLYSQRTQPYSLNGSLIDPAQTAFEINLPLADGGSFRLSDQKGKVVLMFFGYTHCPDFCPTTLSDFKKVKNQLGEISEDVEFVLITIDPDRDTLNIVQSFASRIDPKFIGLSASEEVLTPIWDAYNVFREKDEINPEGNYLMSHSMFVILIDKEGNFRMTFPYGIGARAISEDVTYLLAE